MTRQKYERLTELFHAALEFAPDERAAFLDRVSDGDAELRAELESLLAAHEQRAAYTEKPPDDIAAGMYQAGQDNSAAGAASLAPHTRIDRYEIRSLLGKGGMGGVFLAQDTTLRRLDALKLLPARISRRLSATSWCLGRRFAETKNVSVGVLTAEVLTGPWPFFKRFGDQRATLFDQSAETENLE